MKSMCKALEEIVLPELKNNPFALEQAGLVVASMKLLIDIHEQEFAYLKQEFIDANKLLTHWANNNENVKKIISSKTIKIDVDVEIDSITDLKKQVPKLKNTINTLIEMTNIGNDSDTLLDNFINRQLDRETSWLRLTGFIPNAEQILNIADVLKQQKNEPL